MHNTLTCKKTLPTSSPYMYTFWHRWFVESNCIMPFEFFTSVPFHRIVFAPLRASPKATGSHVEDGNGYPKPDYPMGFTR
jgi:hypothetical protein